MAKTSRHTARVHVRRAQCAVRRAQFPVRRAQSEVRERSVRRAQFAVRRAQFAVRRAQFFWPSFFSKFGFLRTFEPKYLAQLAAARLPKTSFTSPFNRKRTQLIS